MIAVDIIEYKRYDFFKLAQKFKSEEEDMNRILEKLKEFGVVKTVKYSNDQKNLSDLNDDDIENTEVKTEDCYYVFTFVGIIILKNFVIKCYPKYIENHSECRKELKQIIQVIEKYNSSKRQDFNIPNEINEYSKFNMLSIMLFLIEDYYQNGLYINDQNIIESNGNGEILWDKTINETQAIIQNNRPYYLDLFTKKTINNDEDYFKLLHEVILTECSKKLENADILYYFDLIPVDLNNQDLFDFGDRDYIKSRILKEFSIQFNSHKQLLLKAMLAYVCHNDSFIGEMDYFNAYGTNSYNLVWEEICSCVFDDKREESWDHLTLPNGKIHPNFEEEKNLLSLIDKPKWFLENDEGEYDESTNKTLIPDSITFNYKDDGVEFIILDAKYYKWPLTRKPGIGDVTKQYLYELAYKEFIELNGFINSKNCFLFPFDSDEIQHKGYVELKMLKNLCLKNIQIILLPASRINQLYLDNKLLNISELNL